MQNRASTPFTLQMLGEVVLLDREGQRLRFRTRKSLLLLAYLASHADQSWPREKLAALFWAGRQEEQARNSLRTALSDVRRILGTDSLIVDGNTVRLAADVLQTDIDRLEALAEADRGTDGRPLGAFYGGDFLADADVDAEATEWVAGRRAASRDLAVRILEREVARLTQGGETDQAVERARELLSLDPLSEHSHRLLMRLYADRGERSRAIAQYQSCREMLRHELDIEPSEETSRLADEIAVHSEAARSDLRDIARRSAASPSTVALPRDDGPPDISIAVLPFANLSGDAGEDFFADGVSEDILTDLSKVEGLSVAAASSVRPYRTAALRPSEIAEELGVQYVLEGSVRRYDRNLRITASLINGASNRQLWAERYDRELTSVFQVQSEIAAEVADAVQLRLPTGGARPDRQSTQSAEALEHYLRGRALLREMTQSGVEAARQSFEQAVEIDPDYAQAHGGLAEAIAVLAFNYTVSEPLLKDAIEHCHIALELDPGLAEARCSIGLVLSTMERYDEAEVEFRRALEISPDLLEAHYYRGIMFLTTGEADKALEPMRRAFELGRQNLQVGMMYVNCLQSLNLKEQQYSAAEHLLTLAQRRMSLNAYDDQAAYVGGFALAVLDRIEEALRWANVAAAFEIEDPRSTYNVACLFSVLGARERSLELLAKTLRQGVPLRKQSWIRHYDSDWNEVRGTPEFEALFSDP